MKKTIFFLGVLVSFFLFTGCGGGGGDIGSGTSTAAATQKSLAIIANYSQGAATVPTVADYHNVGATGITENMITDVNFLIRGLAYDAVNSEYDIQQALQKRRDALTLLIAYATSHGQSTAPTLSTYRAIGVKGVNANNLQAINAIIAGLVEDRIDTGIKVDAIVTAYTPDTTAPIITLLGNTSINITLHTDFNDPGASAIDDRDGTVAVHITGILNTHTLGTYTLTYTARDLAGNESNVTRIIQVIASPVNNPPSANAGPDQSVQVNTTANLTGTGSDIEGAVNYAWTEGATSLSSNASFGYIPTVVGEHTLTLTVTDSGGLTTTDTVVITATEVPNHAPTANAGADKHVEVNHTIHIIGNGSDNDGSITSYSWSENGTEIATTAAFNYTPSTTGTHTLTLTVTDNNGAMDSDTMKVAVNKSEGSAPAAPSKLNSLWGVNQTEASISWKDNADNETGFRLYTDDGTLHENNIPSKDGSGENVSHRITGLTCGITNRIAVSAYNADGESAKSDYYNITTDACDNENQAPTANAGVDKSVEVNHVIHITGSGTDGDGSIASYLWSENGSQIATVAAFDYTPTTTGSHTLTLTVTDDDGATGSDTIEVNVTDTPNQAPTANAGVDKSVEVNHTIHITGSGTDSDGSINAYEWKKDTSVLSHSAAFDYAPTTTGTHTLTLTVTDDDGATGNDTMMVTVTEASSENHAPTAEGQHVSTNMNTAVTITLTGKDIDEGDTLTYHIVSASGPSHGSFGSTTPPNLIYTPDSGYNGDDSFVFYVNDSKIDSENITVTISVNDTTHVPAAPEEQGAWNQTKTSVRIGIKDNADNEDGFRIYIEGILNGTVTAHAEGAPQKAYTITGLNPGTRYSAYIVAFNAAGESDGFTKVVTTKPNKPPHADAGEGGMIQHDDIITLQGSAYDDDGSIIAYSWTENGDVLGSEARLDYSSAIVGIHTVTFTVTDNDGDTASDTVDVNVTQDPPPNQAPTAMITGLSSDAEQDVSITLDGTASSDRDGTIVSYEWKDGDTTIGTDAKFNKAFSTLGTHTISLSVTDNDGTVGSVSQDIEIKAMGADLVTVGDTIIQTFDGLAAHYDPEDPNAPLTKYASTIETIGANLTFNYFGTKDRGDDNHEGFYIDMNITDVPLGKRWTYSFKIKIPGLDREHHINYHGKLKFNFDYKMKNDMSGIFQLSTEEIKYPGGSTLGGGLYLLNRYEDQWTSLSDDLRSHASMQEIFSADEPTHGANTYYDIKVEDKGLEVDALYIKLSGSSKTQTSWHVVFALDNIGITGTQLDPDVFKERYNDGGTNAKWEAYTSRVNAAINTKLRTPYNALPNLSEINKDSLTSNKQKYQYDKLKTLKDHLDDEITAIEVVSPRVLTKRFERFIANKNRYKATHKILKDSVGITSNDFDTYWVPAMKYGRLDGYTFPLDYTKITDAAPSITMAKGEYRSIAILLDPHPGWNEKRVKFTNTSFSNGGVELDKYVCKIWYQSGRDDSVWDGKKWLTQELLLKNDALVKVLHDPAERFSVEDIGNGVNYLYARRNDGATETLADDMGNVPGYVDITKIAADATKKYALTNRFRAPKNNPAGLYFDDASVMQLITLKKDYYKLLWGIIHVSEDATTGEQHTTLQIQKEDGTVLKNITLSVNVLSYPLDPTSLDYGIYYHSTITDSADNEAPRLRCEANNNCRKTEALIEKELKDMHEHGIGYPVNYTRADDSTRFRRMVEMYKAAGYPSDQFIASEPAIRPMEAGDSDAVSNYASVFNERNRVIKEVFDDNSAKLYVTIHDEPTQSELAYSFNSIDILKGSGRLDYPLKTWTATASYVTYYSVGYLDIPFYSPKAQYGQENERKHAKIFHDAGGKIYTYGDPQTGVENPEIYRRHYGIKIFQVNRDGANDYAQQKGYGFFWNDFDIGQEANHREEAFTYPTTNGLVKTIQYEGYRDAITDSRYITTLYNRAGASKKDEIDSFINNIDISEGTNLDEIRQRIVNKITEY